MDLFNKVRKFLFRCNSCEMIISVEFEEQKDISKVLDAETGLECPCGGTSAVLLD